MSTRTAIVLSRVMVVALLCGSTKAHGGTAVGVYPKTNLISLVAEWKPTRLPLGTVCELEPQWVGTVSRAYLRGGDGVYGEEQANHIRFSHLLVTKDLNGRTNLAILRGRVTSKGELGSFSATEAPAFMSNLPSAKAVSEARTVDDLRKMFGPQHGLADGWGGPGGMHWTESWTWFSLETNGQLRYLGVFAHVASADQKQPAGIDILHITEGFFHPADPDSAAERRDYKTGQEVQAEYEARRAEARAAYQPPLRLLLAARETPDDPDLTAYRRALNEVRRNPSPELFRQFAESLGEGTCEVQTILEDVLFDGFLKLEPWDARQRKAALRALADALPQVKSNLVLDQLVALLLQGMGGGKLKLAVRGSTGVIDVKAERTPDGSRSSFSTGSQNLSPENLSRAALQCREALRARYPELR